MRLASLISSESVSISKEGLVLAYEARFYSSSVIILF
jgi:hypothetical protein